MANTLRIKRRSATGLSGAPTALSSAELAFNEKDDILYYGKGDVVGAASSVIAIAGSGAFSTTGHTHSDITNAMLSNVATGTIKGRATAATGVVEDLTKAQVLSILNVEEGSRALASTSPAALGVAAVGTGTTAARSDHVHVMPSAANVGAMSTSHSANSITGFSTSTAALGTSGAGSATTVSRGDHVHAMPTLNSLGAPTADVPMNSKKLTGLAEPIDTSDAATKNYVDNAVQGLDPKGSVIVATVGSNITLSGLQTIDGVTLVANDRVLVKNQTTESANGIYVASSTAWVRSTDADTWLKLIGAYVFVEKGTTYTDMGFVCTIDAGGTLGSTSIVFQQFSGAGQITAGIGLSKAGNTLSVVTAAAGTLGGVKVGYGLTIDGSSVLSTISLSKYGVLGLGNDATIFQAAINDLQGSKATLLIPENTTVQLGTTAITITGAMRIVGAGGRHRSVISWTGTAIHAITVNTTQACIFEGITFSAPVGATGGSAIQLTGVNEYSQIENCAFTYGTRQVYAVNALSWKISKCYFGAASDAAIYVSCTTNPDAGDSSVTDCLFANFVGAAGQGIYQASGGGLRVINNKFNGGAYGYFMDMAAGATTSILLFQNNSVENQTNSGVRIINTAGTGIMSHVLISDNMFANQPSSINLDSANNFLELVTITGNSISGVATGTGSAALITLTNAPKSVIANNNLYGWKDTVGTVTTVGIALGSGSTRCSVKNNLINGCHLDVSYGATNTIASAASLTLPSGQDTYLISGTTGITSINTAASARGRVIQLVFQGILTVTAGSNLSISSNFTTTAGATLSLVCADDSGNWYEIGRSYPGLVYLNTSSTIDGGSF